MFFKSGNSFFWLDRLGGESHKRGVFFLVPSHKRTPWVFLTFSWWRQLEDNVAPCSIDDTIICSMFISVKCELLYFTHVDYWFCNCNAQLESHFAMLKNYIMFIMQSIMNICKSQFLNIISFALWVFAIHHLHFHLLSWTCNH
jgi:hypothetical protein